MARLSHVAEVRSLGDSSDIIELFRTFVAAQPQGIVLLTEADVERGKCVWGGIRPFSFIAQRDILGY